MLTALLIIVILIIVGLVAIAFLAIAIYNALVSQRNYVSEGWSGIDVQLRRRFNLVGNLVSTVKGYAKHEAETLAEVTNMRTEVRSDDPVARAAAENKVSGALANLFAVSENYPDLKADGNFLELQRELSALEDTIQKARRYYNGAVRTFNTTVESFPSVIIANMFGFVKADFFEIDDDAQRAVTEVDFS
ncbi:MAG: LemA family protein [Alphaproteobacteria bacterium]|nr:LemA family protein [Alphaproteobacteria bacterium]